MSDDIRALLKMLFALWLMQFTCIAAADNEFALWLDDLAVEAKVSGISEQTVHESLARVQLLPEVIEMDRSQPEFVTPFLDYYQKRVDAKKVTAGRQMLLEYSEMLNQVEATYGVSKYLLVAFWGMETQYGKQMGQLDVLSSLATLAYDGRRADFFRGQLLDALRMIELGHVNTEVFNGSWAGAFGNMQFMPTTFMLYAVDGDADGMIDVVNSPADAFASAANYLAQIGWRNDEPVMLQVQLPEGFDWSQAQLEVKKSWREWLELGVQALHVQASQQKPVQHQRQNKVQHVAHRLKHQKSHMHHAGIKSNIVFKSLDTFRLNPESAASIILPQGYRGPAFMVFSNFDVVMDWNRSVNYVLSVAQLAEQLKTDAGIVVGSVFQDGALSYSEMQDLQNILNQKGFDAGEPDGLPGFRTQQALRDYQLTNGLPADGYASRGVYQRLYAEHYQ